MKLKQNTANDRSCFLPPCCSEVIVQCYSDDIQACFLHACTHLLHRSVTLMALYEKVPTLFTLRRSWPVQPARIYGSIVNSIRENTRIELSVILPITPKSLLMNWLSFSVVLYTVF